MKITKKPTIKLNKKTIAPVPLKHIEEESKAEMSEYTKIVRDARVAEGQRAKEHNDPEYWCAFCFQSREQKDEFLHLIGVYEIGDKIIDGMAAAKKMGLTLKTPVPKMPKFRSAVSKAQLAENRRLPGKPVKLAEGVN